MNKIDQSRLADEFRARHKRPPVLLMPNAWDPLSARLFEDAGFEALATTSGGVAWALGYPDGEQAPWAEVVAATRRIVRVVHAPVTADIEAGYADAPDAVADHVEEIIGAGAVGINLEDGLHGAASVRDADDASARIRAARKAAHRIGVPIVINARTDLYHLPEVEGQDRFAETLKRCRIYLEAGADCVYPFGLRDPGVIAALTKAVQAPVNITGRSGMPSAAEFERIGVARITIASAATLASMCAIRQLAEELRATGRFDVLASTMRHPDAQKLFASSER